MFIRRSLPTLSAQHFPARPITGTLILYRPHQTPFILHLVPSHDCGPFFTRQRRLRWTDQMADSMGQQLGSNGRIARPPRILSRSDVYECALGTGVRIGTRKGVDGGEEVEWGGTGLGTRSGLGTSRKGRSQVRGVSAADLNRRALWTASRPRTV